MKATVAQMLARHEGKTLEFKALLASPEPVLKTIVAFANTAGGSLLFGVEDKTRRVVGVADPLALEAKIANLVADAVRPRLVPDIEIHPWRRTHLVAVHVFPSPNAPHYLKALGPEQGAFVRLGSSNRRADRAALDELRRMAANRCYDEEPLADLNSEAIDFRAASELFAPIRKIAARDLSVLGLVTRHAGRTVPTVGGILLFGTVREERFPDAYLQAGRFAGTDRTRILDTVEIRGHLPVLVDGAIGFLRKHEAVALEIGAPRHREKWPIPLVALREAIVNAIVHADYAQRGAPIRLAVLDDRVEIENPGLLPFGLTVEDILAGISKLRNRVVGRVFKELGLIEQWGSGIGRMRSACREAGLPDPRFEEIGRHFRVTLCKTPEPKREVDPVEAAILNLLADGRGHTTAEVARTVGRTPRATRSRLAGLVARGLVHEVGRGKRDPKRQYYLAKKER
jgi:predicted HTH transcriptional regulator